LNELVFAIAGLISGIATGLVGLSAAVVIVPLFSTILGMDPYIAIGIALTSDVIGSGTSAITYAKHKNIDIKNGFPMMVSVLIFTSFSSYISSLGNTQSLASIMNIMAILLGINFIYSSNHDNLIDKFHFKNSILKSILCGIPIGFICGYIGAGGGLMLLIVLKLFLGYDTKKAVGTSVFIMTFTAMAGGIGHILIGGTYLHALIITASCGFIGAKFSAIFANHISQKKLNVVIGVFLIIFGIILTIIYHL